MALMDYDFVFKTRFLSLLHSSLFKQKEIMDIFLKKLRFDNNKIIDRLQ